MIECDVEPMIKPIEVVQMVLACHSWAYHARISLLAVTTSTVFTSSLPFEGMEQAVKVIVELSQRTAVHQK